MKLTDAENAADGIFFPALEQNMMGAVLINEALLNKSDFG